MNSYTINNSRLGWNYVYGGRGLKRVSGISQLKMPIPDGRTKNPRKYLFKTRPQDRAGVCARFDVKAGEQRQLKIALSYTSIENARNNLRVECDHWDFARVRKDARD